MVAVSAVALPHEWRPLRGGAVVTYRSRIRDPGPRAYRAMAVKFVIVAIMLAGIAVWIAMAPIAYGLTNAPAIAR